MPSALLAIRRQDACTLTLLLAASALTLTFDLRILGLVVVAAGFGLAGRGLAEMIVPARTGLDRLLAALTFAFASLAVAAEGLSLAVLLGSPAAWTGMAVVCGAAGVLLMAANRKRCASVGARLASPASPNASSASPNTSPASPSASPALVWWSASRRGKPRPYTDWLLVPDNTEDRLARVGYLLASLLLLTALLHLATEFVLSWFAGINVGDSITHYLPRSVRFLQFGTFGIQETYYDFMQYFHQTVVAVQLLFLRSDVLVNPFSFLAASLTIAAIFALARSLGWPRPYPLFAALTPLAMPIVLLHAVTSNFDTFIALWILLALYFLRRGFALSTSGWLIAAATATALAFATKPTAWFVMPGLGLIWLAALGRAAVRGRFRRALPTFAACAVIFVLVGMPFLLRNVISRGYIVAPPEWQNFQLGEQSGSQPVRYTASACSASTRWRSASSW